MLLLPFSVHAEIDPVVHRDYVRPLLIDTSGAWYHSDRVYYNPLGTYKYTGADFFNAIDLPTVFGLGFNPTGNEKGVGYYAQMFLEWRSYKTFGWFAMVGLDTHDQSYENMVFPSDWTPQPLAFVAYPKSMRNQNITSANISTGTVYNMELMAGAGYRLPLVRDLADFYAHPYLNRFNLGAAVELGYAWSRLSHVTLADDQKTYSLADANYFHPVMKFNLMGEFFLGQFFTVFLQGSYLQHLTYMPWDNPNTRAGTLAFSIGFTGFFN